MKTEFVVITESGDTSYSAKRAEPESFRSFKDACKRAKGLANLAPGHEIGVFKRVGVMRANVIAAQMTKDDGR